MPHRFFVPSRIQRDCVALTGSEAHHLSAVLRAKVGTQVVLFDGSGAEFAARVTHIGRSAVELAVLSRCPVDRELPFALTLGVALPKGDRQRWLIEKAVELGVARVVPLISARGVALPTARTVARLRRVVVETSKQCGRNRLMVLAEPATVAGYIAQTGSDGRRFILHPGSPPFSAQDDPRSPVSLAIGPEGGFTGEELLQATSAGWRPVSLGPRTLRVETAALAMAALVGLQQ